MKDYNVNATIKSDTGKHKISFVVALADSYAEASDRATKMLCANGIPEDAIIKLIISPKN